MNDEIKLREQICILAKSMFDRGLTGGSTGNISSRTSDGGLLVSPTGTSFGRLDPGRLSRFDADGEFMSGDKPTKEMPLQKLFQPIVVTPERRDRCCTIFKKNHVCTLHVHKCKVGD